MTHSRLRADYQTLVQFVRASDLNRNKFQNLKSSSAKNNSGNNLDGQKVRTFYENVISSDFGASEDKTVRKRSCLKQKQVLKKRINKSQQHFSKPGFSGENASRRVDRVQRKASCSVTTSRNDEGNEDKESVTEKSSFPRNESSVISGNVESDDRLGLRLLKHAQDGDIKQIKTCLDQGVSVDFQDQFGWTALMCAAVGGHTETVQFLLEKQNADRFKKDKSGFTASDRARQKRRHSVVWFFENLPVPKTVVKLEPGLRQVKLEPGSTPASSEHELTNVNLEFNSTRVKIEPGLTTVNSEQILTNSEAVPNSSLNVNTEVDSTFFCSVCKQEFFNTNKKKHETSTVHLFSMQLKPKARNYLIPESNVGYRMLLKGGWDVDKGLGPDGTGNKFPVKTILKRDRKGLGSDKKESAKVTHFRPHDTRAVINMKRVSERKMSVRTLSKRAMRMKEKRDKEWEIRLRQYMNSD